MSEPSRLRRLLRWAWIPPVLLVLGMVPLARCFWVGTQAPERVVHDVTQLVHIPVQRVVPPRSTADVKRLLAMHEGPVSIGGGRFSMGGQIGTDGTLFLDTRGMNDVLDLDVENKVATVEAGITWHDLQAAIDPHDLSVSIMQSYGDFTVGGTLSVNAHGRYVNRGPVVQSVRSIELVLADGRQVHASPEENSDIFYAAIGGYGGLGVITEATLDLEDNVHCERSVARMPAGDFQSWFAENIEGNDKAVFFNADLYPPDYDEMVAITFSETDRPVTEKQRLQTKDHSTVKDRFTYWWVSEAPLGKQARSEIIDRMRLGGKPVVYRNFEASYHVGELEPASRKKSTYVLQEYFIPVENFDAFVPKMADVFNRYKVNVVNVSIRHATPDPGTLLAWAPVEAYAFVIYYKQGTAEHEQTEVGVWTRAMNDAILSEGGTFYLPYQPHHTQEQFEQAYPRHVAYFDMKRRLDPDYTFRNKLWDRYFPPEQANAQKAADAVTAAALEARTDWERPEDQTFLTLPEWYIVYSADELGDHLQTRPPSEFPYFQSICQFCEVYGAVSGSIKGRYPRNWGYHGMIWVIGASYIAEYTVKGVYENTIGRLSEMATGDAWKTGAMDRYYATVATDYGAFIHHTPWYAFNWGGQRRGMPGGIGGLRGTERRFAVWAELSLKGIWAWTMGGASNAAYGVEEARVLGWIRAPGLDDAGLAAIEGIEVVEHLDGDDVLVSIPRYEPFTRSVPALARSGAEIVQIAGGETIVVQVIADTDWPDAALYGDVVWAWPILTQPGKQRMALEVPVARLHEIVPSLPEGVVLEHVYDY